MYEAGKVPTNNDKYRVKMDTDLDYEGYYNIVYGYARYSINDAKDKPGWMPSRPSKQWRCGAR